MFALAALLAGCGAKPADESSGGNPYDSNGESGDAAETATGDYEGEGPDAEGDAGSGYTAPSIDYDAAFSAFAPDAVMISAGDYSVTWALLFAFLYGNINDIVYNTGAVPKWSDVLYEDMTLADALLQYSVDNAVFYMAVEYGVAQSGISLTEEDYEIMDQDLEGAFDAYGGKEAFLDMLWKSNGCHSLELYKYLISIAMLANNFFGETYGDTGSLLADEDIEEYVSSDGYMMAKHILRLKPEEGEEDTAQQEIEDIYNNLEQYTGDDLEAYFCELMVEHTEDDLGTFPNGYLFQYSDMVPEFSEACRNLEIGAYSGIVESVYGYHIIYRLPLDYNEIPLANFFQGDYTPLRQIAALGMFDSVMSGWVQSMDIVNSADLDNMDLSAIFK
jgi:hypothetical protein